MQAAFETYQMLGCTFDPFYERKNPELQQLVDDHTPLTNSDIQDIITFLADAEDEYKQYFTMAF